MLRPESETHAVGQLGSAFFNLPTAEASALEDFLFYLLRHVWTWTTLTIVLLVIVLVLGVRGAFAKMKFRR